MISTRSLFVFIVLNCVLNCAIACVIGCACLASAEETQEGRLQRFPDIYKDKIAFMYGGDLWLASSSGGMARRITSHPGRELFPKFSPDGKSGIHRPVRRQL